MNDMDVTESSPRWGGLIELQWQQLGQVVLLGLVVGVVGWLVTLIARDAILTPMMCGESSGVCTSAVSITNIFVAVIVAIVGLMGLVRLGIYRPIIIVLAALISLWNLTSWTVGLAGYTELIWFAVLYALCFATFAWLVRPRSMAIVLIIVLPVVILARVLPVL